MLHFVLVVRKGEGADVFEYLTGDSRQRTSWTTVPSEAFSYGSQVAFAEAKQLAAKVFLRLPEGREIEVEADDFRPDFWM